MFANPKPYRVTLSKTNSAVTVPSPAALASPISVSKIFRTVVLRVKLPHDFLPDELSVHGSVWRDTKSSALHNFKNVKIFPSTHLW